MVTFKSLQVFPTAVLPSACLGLWLVCPAQGGVCTLTPQLEGVWGQGNKMLGWRGMMELGVVFAGVWTGACGRVSQGSADGLAELAWPWAGGFACQREQGTRTRLYACWSVAF